MWWAIIATVAPIQTSPAAAATFSAIDIEFS
jgi:hypothetical protein